MPEKTEAQKRAQKAYMGKFIRVEIRISPEKHEAIKAHALQKEESVNSFINRAIDETMERDTSQQPVGTPVRAANPLEGIILPLTLSEPHRRQHRPQERTFPLSWPVLLTGR